MNRREALHALAAAVSAAALPAAARSATADQSARTGMGLVTYCLGHRQRAGKRSGQIPDLFEPLVFLEHCRKLGAGGIQAPLGVRDDAYAAELRRKAEQYGMYVEGIASLPSDPAALERFDAEMRTAALCGARAVRTVMLPGRRYEFFESLAQFREFEARGRRSLEMAAPVAQKHRVPLGLENHKDHRAAQRAELLRQIGSEYVGACVDTGNNLALLEDSLDVVKALAPFAVSVHLKDQAVAEYDQGFLLADVPLGKGCLDLKAVVDALRQAKPDVRFSLELITRDPLKVPCLGERYWATFPDLPGQDLARTLRKVRAKAAKTLPDVGSLSPEQQVAAEAANVDASLVYARDVLRIA
jgi:sugar phosphate isomerase/epimerase